MTKNQWNRKDYSEKKQYQSILSNSWLGAQCLQKIFLKAGCCDYKKVKRTWQFIFGRILHWILDLIKRTYGKFFNNGVFPTCVTIMFKQLVFYHSYACSHHSDVIMSAMASPITSVSIVCSAVYSANQRKHQSSASLAFVRGIHRWPHNGQ